MFCIEKGNKKICVIKEDITKLKVDAIVNAANNTLLGGGGVDGAIHRAGGSEILEECKKIGGCATGDAKITTAGKLPSKYVIHTVGPIFSDKEKDREDLKSAYLSSLKLAEENNLNNIAFSSISTGVYGFPKKEAVEISTKLVIDFISNSTNLKEVIFCVFSYEQYELYKEELKKYENN